MQAWLEDKELQSADIDYGRQLDLNIGEKFIRHINRELYLYIATKGDDESFILRRLLLRQRLNLILLQLHCITVNHRNDEIS